MVRDLEAKLFFLEQDDLANHPHMIDPITGKKKEEVRIWMDGVFDMMHYGHMNAFRQGRGLGTHLIVGVNSDESITACKGKPICSEQERIDTVRGCKWVDEVVEGVPYIMNDEYLSSIITKYRIDYVVHGDDPCIVDGKNVYESAIKLGKYLTIPRTEGVSTTDIVGRMLLLTRTHHNSSTPQQTLNTNRRPSDATLASQQVNTSSPVDRRSNFLTTSRVIRLFNANVHAPEPSSRVIYVAGAWDMFHAGHIEFLRKARMLGDYVIAGVQGDEIVNRRQGMNLPIMTLHERVLSVLGCQYVDDVLIDAPEEVTQEMISSLHISLVAIRQLKPSTAQNTSADASTDTSADSEDDIPVGYNLPASKGILRRVPVEYNITALDFVERIQNQHERFTNRFQAKMAAEVDFYKHKYNL